MSKKIKQIGLALIILILLLAVASLIYVKATSVDSVKKGAVIMQNNKVVVSWKSNKKLDGYILYYSKSDSDDWQQTKIENASTDYLELTELEDCTSYKFCISGYKVYNDTIKEGECSGEFKLFTPPKKQEITACDSLQEGVISLQWTQNANAKGYKINYSSKEDMSESTTIDIDDNTVASYDLADLEVGSTLYFTLNSYAVNDKDEIVLGESSDVKSAKVMEKIVAPSDIDPNKPMVALTFDDGPNPLSTPIVLDTLQQYNARATFFMIADNEYDGNGVIDNKSLVKRMVDLKCELGNHTYSHERYGTDVTVNDIKGCSDAIYEITGQYPTAFRSTGGKTTENIRTECRAEGLPIYYWSCDTEDWKPSNRNTQYVSDYVLNNVKDGDIVLMHDIRMTTAEATKTIIPELINRGYQLVTVSELVYYKSGSQPVPGEQYMNGTTVRNNTN